jgi:site-specific recombinase XerD
VDWQIGSMTAAPAPNSPRRTKVVQLYSKTVNLRAVQSLLGRATIDTTVRYLGVKVCDAPRLAEQIEL